MGIAIIGSYIWKIGFQLNNYLGKVRGCDLVGGVVSQWVGYCFQKHMSGPQSPCPQPVDQDVKFFLSATLLPDLMMVDYPSETESKIRVINFICKS